MLKPDPPSILRIVSGISAFKLRIMYLQVLPQLDH